MDAATNEILSRQPAGLSSVPVCVDSSERPENIQNGTKGDEKDVMVGEVPKGAAPIQTIGQYSIPDRTL